MKQDRFRSVVSSMTAGSRRISRVLLALALTLYCAANVVGSGEDEPTLDRRGFPEFITSAENYYVTRIAGVPEIDGETFRLEVGGLVDSPRSFSLPELYQMADTEMPLTVECIGNSRGGSLLSTAEWKGINLYELLADLGIDETATGVRYEAADGYYASHTLEQLRDNGVLLALYMNGDPIPPLHGFPVRVLNPGYYGVKQPAWVVSIEVVDRPLEDYWNDRGWDVSPPIAIDSKFFSPGQGETFASGEKIRLTGAAYGGTRVAKVEVTTDRGETWTQAEIVHSVDADNVWVFWETEVSFVRRGSQIVNVRATDINGNEQQEDDPEKFDGNNDWGVLRMTIR